MGARTQIAQRAQTTQMEERWRISARRVHTLRIHHLFATNSTVTVTVTVTGHGSRDTRHEIKKENRACDRRPTPLPKPNEVAMQGNGDAPGVLRDWRAPFSTTVHRGPWPRSVTVTVTVTVTAQQRTCEKV
jgi:hypothetical protein